MAGRPLRRARRNQAHRDLEPRNDFERVLQSGDEYEIKRVLALAGSLIGEANSSLNRIMPHILRDAGFTDRFEHDGLETAFNHLGRGYGMLHDVLVHAYQVPKAELHPVTTVNTMPAPDRKRKRRR